jgi:hypothetical protein
VTAFDNPDQARPSSLHRGTYQLRLTETVGVNIGTVTAGVSTPPPTVEAGFGPQRHGRKHQARQRRWPPSGAPLVSTWSQVSGPGTVTFSNSHDLHAAATFSLSGTYVLRLTVSDSEFTAADELTLTVLGNRPPIVSAGPDQTATLLVLQPPAGPAANFPVYPPPAVPQFQSSFGHGE